MRPDCRSVYEIIQEKCRFKGIAFPTFKSLEREPERSELETEWSNMLAHQLPFLPPFEQFWSELSQVFEWLTGGAKPVTLERISFDPDEDVTWAPPATAQPWGARVPLEIIRFAGANRLCVNLGYEGSLRLVEPYSLRRTKEGNLVLNAIRVDDREPRSYRVDRIESAEVVQKTFSPVYAVELSPSVPIHAPLQSKSTRSARLRRSGGTLCSKRVFSTPSLRYVLKCTTCGKQLTRQTFNATLKPHKSKSGHLCYGTCAQYIMQKYS